MGGLAERAVSGGGLRLRGRPIASAEELAAAVSSKRIAAKAVVREAMARIRAEDGEVRAWVCFNPLAERRSVGAGREGGKLAGVPFGVKDLIDVAGLPSALGLTGQEHRPAAAMRSAAVVRRLEAEGAVALGKTVTTALAFDRPGPTRHPLDTRRTPGASSSGSAAAVAAGMVPLALGSQAVGSVIRPASYCGVWACVPSLGAVPADGSLVLSVTLDRIGVFASTGEGLELALQAILGAGSEGAPADSASRIGVMTGRRIAGRAPEAVSKLVALAEALPGDIGPLDIDPDWTVLLDAARSIAAYEFHAGIERKHTPIATLDRELIASIAPEKPAGRAYSEALEFRERLARDWERATAGFDAVLLPSAVAEAPVGALDDQDPAPAALGSLLGVPAVNIPLFASSSGLPLGCQLLGRRGADMATIALARRIASRFAGHERRFL